MIAKFTPVSLALVCAVALSGASCEPSDVAYYTALLKGQPTAEQVEQFIADTPLDVVVEDSSSEEVVTVAVVVPEPSVEPEPEVVVPPPCDDWTWRGRVYSCTGTWLYDL